MKIGYEECYFLMTEIFEKAGLSHKRAEQQAKLFAETEAYGIVSHGVALTLKYTQLFLKGTINTEPEINIVCKEKAVAVLDGGQGLGVAVIEEAISQAMKMASEFGTGIVTVTNLQHYAAGIYYGRRPTHAGMLFTMMANTPGTMAPYGSRQRYFGTNPMTFAAPMGKYPVYCLDMATSAVAGNKVENAYIMGEKIAEGIGIDRKGRSCTDPKEIMTAGALLPFGGAKGSGLAGMINIQAGILSGAAYRNDVVSLCRETDNPANYGCFIQVTDISKFLSFEKYTERAELWVEDILASPPADGFERVVYPGYMEQWRYAQAIKNGLELTAAGVHNLVEAGKLVGVTVTNRLYEI